MKEKILEKFLRYVKIDTQSDESVSTCPSTQKQFDLAKVLLAELKEMGIEASLDNNCYIMAKIPANINESIPKVGFIAHMDTSPDYSGKNVDPKIHENYNGGILKLSENTSLDPKEFPELLKYEGQTLITSDGTTLLGADDKAGVAEIMTAAEYIVNHPEIKHGDILIGFTPDEEIGRGPNLFDVLKFGADFAYTLDGGEIGELEYENFNAAYAKIDFLGRNVHPGNAKNKMVNSMQSAMEFHAMLPVHERPEFTDKYEGFFHLINIEGSVEKTTITYIIRDHDRVKFEKKKELVKTMVQLLEKKHTNLSIEVDMKDQYYNMKEKVEPQMHIIDLAVAAFEKSGVQPNIKAIRGGTDGARLSFMGLPCPNIFAGGHNFHGRYEFVPLESMEKSVEIILNIVKLATE